MMACDSSNKKIENEISSNDVPSTQINSMDERLNGVSNNYEAVKEISFKYLKIDGKQTGNNLEIYSQKWVAPLKYGIIIYEQTPNDHVKKFENDNNKRIPRIYKDFLLEINGCFIFDLSLFGLTPSIYETGLLDRSKVQCFDLGTANRNWISEYNVDEELFHFGSRSHSYDENIGYFIDDTGRIKSIRKNGQIIKEWTEFADFLKDEIAVVEKMMIEELPIEEKNKL